MLGCNTCGRWVNSFMENKVNDIKDNGTFKKLHTEAIEWEYYGFNPFTTIHVAVKIVFPNGKIAYIDQGGLGTDGQIIFPSDLKGQPLKQPDQRFGTCKKEIQDIPDLCAPLQG